MYLSHFIPLSPPYMATWRGKSGKIYEFGVVDGGHPLRDGPAVGVLVEHCPGGSTVPLWVGRNTGNAEVGWTFPLPTERWQHGKRGRLMMHVRFEALWQGAQQAEIDDLIAGLDPPLNASTAAAVEPALTAVLEPTETETAQPARASADEPSTAVAAAEAPRDSTTGPVAPERPAAAVEGKPSHRYRLSGLCASVSRILHRPHPPKVAGVGERKKQATPHDVPATAPIKPQTASAAELAAAPMPSTAATVARANPAVVALKEDAIVGSVAAATTRSVEASPAPPPRAPVELRVLPGAPSTTAEPPAPSAKAIAADCPVVVLFAGEMAHATGVDLLVEAAAVVAGDPVETRFLFVGDGPLKAEMMARAHAAGSAQRCRFLGHLDSDDFAAVVDDVDIVVVPGRVAQHRSVARRALAAGRWLLTTHQACIDGVEHGRNGLVTYDNAGSLVWGLRELTGRVVQQRRGMTSERAA